MTNDPESVAPAPHRWMRAYGGLPLRVVHGLGALLGWVVYVLSPRYRRMLRANLAQAGLDTAGLRRRAVAEAGRMVAELPWIWARSPQELVRRVRCEQAELLDAAEAERRGILFLTPHLGAFEMTARYYASRRPITVLYRPPKRAWLRSLVAAGRRGAGLRAVPVGGAGIRAMLRALRAGEAVGLLPDQVPGGGQGRWVPFFGRAAYSMVLPERLAAQTGAAVVLAVGERLRGGRGWRLHLERLDGPPTPERLNACFERLVRLLPEQYLWAYNRYKRPAGVEPAPGHA